MPQLKAHEFLELQELVRSETAAAATYRMMAQQCQDPQLKEFVERQAQMAEQSAQQFLGFLRG